VTATRIWTPPAASAPSLKSHADDVAVAPDGSWLATASGDGTVRIWDTVTGHPKAPPSGRL